MPLLADPALQRHRSLASAPAAPAGPVAPPADLDQRVILYGMTWKDYEIMLAIRGDRAGVRMAYMNGAIELTSPSLNHEGVKKTIARLVEAYGDEQGLKLNGYGSWTLKNAFLERGLEPDECYVLGTPKEDIPQLAIEVVWTSGGLNKLEIYRSLGVREVWIWKRGRGITIHLLQGDRYEEAEKSALLPDLDMRLIERFATSEDQSQAVREFRAALRNAAAAPRAPRSRAGTAASPKTRTTPERAAAPSRRRRTK